MHASSSRRHYLADHYELGEYDVYCGRGNVGMNHSGNHHLHTIVGTMLPRYVEAQTKRQKADIIMEVIQLIRTLSPNGGFVKQDLENWKYYEICDSEARDRVSQAFRDAIRSQEETSENPKKESLKEQQYSKKRIRTTKKDKTATDNVDSKPEPSSTTSRIPKVSKWRASSDSDDNNRSEPNFILDKKLLRSPHEESAVKQSITMTSDDGYLFPSTISSLRPDPLEHYPMTPVVATSSNQNLNTTLIDRSTRYDTTERIHMDLLLFSTISGIENTLRQQITNVQPTFRVSDVRYTHHETEEKNDDERFVRFLLEYSDNFEQNDDVTNYNCYEPNPI